MPRRSSTLQDEIKQTRPFRSSAEEVVVSVLRTAAVMQRHLAQVVEAHGVTIQQYNVLRILRGAGEGGLCRNELRDRMLTRMPDMTRLLDRMEEAGLVTRSREREDRRMVLTRISARGRALLSELDGPMSDLHRDQLRRLTNEQLRTLIDLLTAVREGNVG